MHELSAGAANREPTCAAAVEETKGCLAIEVKRHISRYGVMMQNKNDIELVSCDFLRERTGRRQTQYGII